MEKLFKSLMGIVYKFRFIYSKVFKLLLIKKLWLLEYLALKVQENQLCLTLFLAVISQAAMGDVQMEYMELTTL